MFVPFQIDLPVMPVAALFRYLRDLPHQTCNRHADPLRITRRYPHVIPEPFPRYVYILDCFGYWIACFKIHQVRAALKSVVLIYYPRN
jgi:hypothetical protein